MEKTYAYVIFLSSFSERMSDKLAKMSICMFCFHGQLVQLFGGTLATRILGAGAECISRTLT